MGLRQTFTVISEHVNSLMYLVRDYDTMDCCSEL